MRYVLELSLAVLLVGPAWAQKAPAPEQELIALEHNWKQAVVDRDAKALEQLYAEEYTTTDQEGTVWNKAQDIAIDTEGSSRLTWFNLDDLKVRLYGNTAVVTGRMMSKGFIQNSAAVNEARFTDVFVKRAGRWQCIASQSTPVSVW